MERELIVTLLKKNIDDLILLTEGFEEMTSYPRALIQLAQLKTTDIKQYLYELGEWKPAIEHVPVSLIEACENDVRIETATEEHAETQETSVEEELTSDKTEEVTEVMEEDELIENEEPEEEVTEEELIPEEEEVVEEEKVEEPITEPVEETAEYEPAPLSPVVTETVVQDAQPSEPEPITENDPEAEESTATKAPPVTEDHEEENKQLTLGEKLAMGISRNEMHTTGEASRLSSSLGNTKIDDIRQAISIGDRFRFQRELFRNNGEEMNKMLNYINLLASFQEIESFLQKKYGWTDDNQAAKDLYAIVRRKFL